MAPDLGPPPLRVLVGFSRASASDDLLRLLAPGLSAELGRSVRVDLMPGDRGARAARTARTCAPDGNTLLVATLGTHAIAPNLRRHLGYDAIADFAPVCLATRSPLILGVRTSLGARDVADLVAMSERAPLSFGSSGVGSAPHLAGSMFRKETGARMRHRAYDDTRQLYADLAAGRLDLSFNNAAGMAPRVRAGTVRALAVTTATRSAVLPDTPTLTEAGLAGFDLSNWLGFVAPAGTGPQIVDAQARAIAAALASPGVAGSLAADGIEPVGSTPAEFAAFLAAEIDGLSWLRTA